VVTLLNVILQCQALKSWISKTAWLWPVTGRLVLEQHHIMQLDGIQWLWSHLKPLLCQCSQLRFVTCSVSLFQSCEKVSLQSDSFLSS
jgi:hypothetical protein